jgi:hypothetical protein
MTGEILLKDTQNPVSAGPTKVRELTLHYFTLVPLILDG